VGDVGDATVGGAAANNCVDRLLVLVEAVSISGYNCFAVDRLGIIGSVEFPWTEEISSAKEEDSVKRFDSSGGAVLSV
jgi:hypothetical protein